MAGVGAASSIAQGTGRQLASDLEHRPASVRVTEVGAASSIAQGASRQLASDLQQRPASITHLCFLQSPWGNVELDRLKDTKCSECCLAACTKGSWNKSAIGCEAISVLEE